VGAKLLDLTSPMGRTFLAACLEILDRPETQEVVSRVLNLIGHRCALADLDQIQAHEAFLNLWPDLAADAAACLRLGAVDETLVAPVFSRSTAIGSLMRRKIAPITDPIRADLRCLLGRDQ
jgi:hypothetical protein